MNSPWAIHHLAAARSLDCGGSLAPVCCSLLERTCDILVRWGDADVVFLARWMEGEQSPAMFLLRGPFFPSSSQTAVCVLPSRSLNTDHARLVFAPEDAALGSCKSGSCAYIFHRDLLFDLLTRSCLVECISSVKAVNSIAGKFRCFSRVLTFIFRHASQAAAAAGRTEARPVSELASITSIVRLLQMNPCVGFRVHPGVEAERGAVPDILRGGEFRLFETLIGSFDQFGY